MVIDASCTKPRKLVASYSQRTRSRRFHWSHAKRRSTSQRRSYRHAIVLEVVIEAIAVIGAVSNEMLGLVLQPGEVETELHQGDFMMIGGMRTHRERQPMAIHNREDRHALAAFGKAHDVAPAIHGLKCGVDEALALINCVLAAQRIGQFGEDLVQDLALTPLLKPTMHRPVVVALESRCHCAQYSESTTPLPRSRVSAPAYGRSQAWDVLFGKLCTYLLH